ncbi:DUF6020 family protein [Listeria sp. PSOL-1]|uniref:DUF6020 family protein n=1 Tax=Listeria sp. PSOL-1 TaxID=1844999 RepID=UPI001E64C85B|nr:DUF6020 family protein [Listeria sp. PSOL-1]
MTQGLRSYNAWHPILHTLWIKATTLIYNSPASYIFSQIIVVALCVGFAIYTLTKLGLPKFLAYLLSLFYALWPVMMFYSVTMWKDIPFAAFILLFTTLWIKVIFSKGAWLKRPINMIAIILVGFVVINLRNNGSFVVIGTLIMFVIFLRGFRIRLGLILIGVLAVNMLFTTVINNILHATPNPLNQALAVPSQQIAATFYNNGKISNELKAYFTKILPEENWKKDYNPYTVDPIKHDEKYNSKPIDQDFGLYIKNWAKLMKDNFTIYVKAYLHQTSAIWRYQSPNHHKVFFGTKQDLEKANYDVRVFALYYGGGKNNDYINMRAYAKYKDDIKLTGQTAVSFNEYVKHRAETSKDTLVSDSKFKLYNTFLNKLYDKIQTSGQNIFLKGAIPLLLLFLAFVANLNRSKGENWLIFLPIVITIITIAIAMPATDFRYSFSFIFTVPIILFVSKLRANQDTV